MNCLICFNDIENKYVSYKCECGYIHLLHCNCCKKWIEKKDGNFCLMCHEKITSKIKNKKLKVKSCF